MQEEANSRNPPWRACLVCRKRKIKCSRGQPCQYCEKLSLECTYSDVKVKEKETPTDEVASRLERIEALLQNLDLKISNTVTPPTETPTTSDRPSPASLSSDISQRLSKTKSSMKGKLIPGNDGRYVTHSFWRGLDETDARQNDSSSEPTLPRSDSILLSSSDNPRESTIPEADAISRGTLQFHPTTDQLFALWKVYLANVDPICKLLHTPSTQRQLLRANEDLTEVPPAFEALMFAIYFAAITSIPSSTSMRAFHEDRPVLLSRYRLGLEQALAKANYMSRTNVTIVQALTLFLICARMSVDKEYVWSMTGFLIRFATKLGLQHDPADLGLTPFRAEMRRRLWWQIYVLDIRTAEDFDMDPSICEHTFDTRFPANVNDADFDEDTTHELAGTNDRTEMLFTLLRTEVSCAARHIIFTPELATNYPHSNVSPSERRDLIDQLMSKLEQKYFKYCDPQVPICFLAESATRMVITKIQLTMNHPARNGSAYCQTVMRDLALRSIDLIENAHVLRTDDKYSRWVWLWEKYVDWDAVAFLLHVIVAAPACVPFKRAWTAIDIFFGDWSGRAVDTERWSRLQHLRTKAAEKSRATTPATIENTPQGNLPNNNFSRVPFGGSDSANYFMTDTGQLPAYVTSGTHANDPMDCTTACPDTLQAGNTDTVNMGNDLDWTFDDFSIAPGGPSWDMDFEQESFQIQGLDT